MKIIGVIPARYKSSRFPGKPLADICGKPMIWWVYQQCKKVKDFSEVYVSAITSDFDRLFELAWKTMKDCLENQGIVGKIGSPREILKEAFSAGLIEDGEVWMDMMLSRNELSHLYDEETSREIYDDIKEKYILEINKLVQKLDNI